MMSWYEYQRRGDKNETKPRSQAWGAETRSFVSRKQWCTYPFCDDRIIMQGEVCYQVKRHGLWHLQCYMKDTLRAFEQAERERRNRICPECKKGYLAPHDSYHYETREVSYTQMNGTEHKMDVQGIERDGRYVSCGNCKHKFDLEEDRDWAWEVT